MLKNLDGGLGDGMSKEDIKELYDDLLSGGRMAEKHHIYEEYKGMLQRHINRKTTFPFCISSAFLARMMPLLARKFLVQTVLFSVFISEKIRKTKAIGKDSSSRKKKKRGKYAEK